MNLRNSNVFRTLIHPLLCTNKKCHRWQARERRVRSAGETHLADDGGESARTIAIIINDLAMCIFETFIFADVSFEPALAVLPRGH